MADVFGRADTSKMGQFRKIFLPQLPRKTFATDC